MLIDVFTTLLISCYKGKSFLKNHSSQYKFRKKEKHIPNNKKVLSIKKVHLLSLCNRITILQKPRFNWIQDPMHEYKWYKISLKTIQQHFRHSLLGKLQKKKVENIRIFSFINRRAEQNHSSTNIRTTPKS